ncbi:hypothetical protein EPI10_027865 [Gossypium australe]|uniref:Uncharacterized protein n=1 Tax=Gossypium australe TaxID=47621 RepID=A0A5B6UX85_9ROSI|nr:hypothetical protein EPI10_027865 [Gossypium australe]
MGNFICNNNINPYSNTYNSGGNTSNAIRQNAVSVPPRYNQPLPRKMLSKIQLQVIHLWEILLKDDTESSQYQGKEQCKAITLQSGTQLPGVLNDTIPEEGSSTIANEKIPKAVGEKATKKKSC